VEWSDSRAINDECRSLEAVRTRAPNAFSEFLFVFAFAVSYKFHSRIKGDLDTDSIVDAFVVSGQMILRPPFV
jgi:hypothetical protein